MKPTSLYERILGSSFNALAPILQNIHDTRRAKTYAGRCTVRAGENRVAKVIARVAGLPVATAEVPVEVAILSGDRAEQWTRTFGVRKMRSVLADRGQLLEERLGPVVLTFELTASPQTIVWTLKRARLAFVRLPISRLLSCAAREAVENGRYTFDVSAHVRGIGLIVHYRGWLVVA